jgi:hypothetical protein
MKTKVSDQEKLLTVIRNKNLTIPEAIRIIKFTYPKTIEEEFNLNVDYKRSLEEMIRAGNYDWYDKSINEKHLPLPAQFIGRKIELKAKLVHFNRVMSSNDVIASLAESEPHFRLATLAEQLAFSEFNPELQKQFPIVALGSRWKNIFCSSAVPILIFDDYRRCLSLDWYKGNWDHYCHFLIVSNLFNYV